MKIVSNKVGSQLDDQWYNKQCTGVTTETVVTESVLPVYSDSNTPIVFNVKAMPSKYIDTGGIQLHVRWNVFKKNATGAWTRLEVTDKVSVPNNAHHMMFDEMLVYVNGDLVEQTGLNYGITTYFKNLLYADDFDKTTKLQSSMWYPDTNGLSDLVDKNEDINKG